MYSVALCESLIAVHGYVFVDIFGVDDAAVAQRDSLLLLIELSLVEALDGVAGHGVVIEQVLDYSALDEVLVNYLGDVLNLYLAVGTHPRDRQRLSGPGRTDRSSLS